MEVKESVVAERGIHAAVGPKPADEDSGRIGEVIIIAIVSIAGYEYAPIGQWNDFGNNFPRGGQVYDHTAVVAEKRVRPAQRIGAGYQYVEHNLSLFMSCARRQNPALCIQNGGYTTVGIVPKIGSDAPARPNTLIVCAVRQQVQQCHICAVGAAGMPGQNNFPARQVQCGIAAVVSVNKVRGGGSGSEMN